MHGIKHEPKGKAKKQQQKKKKSNHSLVSDLSTLSDTATEMIKT